MKDKFLDTNVLIYAYSISEREKRNKAVEILSADVVISAQVINEFIWVMYKKYNISLEMLKKTTRSFFSLYHVIIIEHHIIEKALDIMELYKYSYWDSLMLSAALDSNCSIIYSEDMQHGQIIDNRLKIINPFIKIFLF